MGSKGTTSYQAQQYTPYQGVSSAGQQALNQAQSAASSPLNIPLLGTAGFSPLQTQSFGEIQGLQGAANPYINQASAYANQSTNPLANLQSYLNPYTQQVTQATQAAFNNANQQQQSTLLGNAAAQGALGGDRSAVAQAVLAGQQQAQQAPVLANIQSQGYQQAVQGAQNQAQLQAGAAYSLGNLGSLYQNLGLQGAQSLYGAGAAQQGLQQQQLQNTYNQQLAQLAVPYQQAQFLAGVTGGLAPALGGTTTGQSTQPGPSLASQLLGLGVAGIGLGTGIPALGTAFGGLSGLFGQQTKAGGGASIGDDPFSGLVIPNIALHMGSGERPMMKFPTQDNQNIDPMKAISAMGSLSKIGSNPVNVGSATVTGEATGGAVNPYDMAQSFEEGGTPNFDDTFAAAYGQPPTPTFNDRFSGQPSKDISDLPVPLAKSYINAANAQNVNSPDLQIPTLPRMGADWGSGKDALSAIQAAAPQSQDQEIPLAFSGDPAGAPTSRPPPSVGGEPDFANTPVPAVHTGSDWMRSPGYALFQLGAAIAAGRHPGPGGIISNIGQGMLQGAKAFEEQRKGEREDLTVEQRAKQLQQQADFHRDQYSKQTASDKARLALEKLKIDRDRYHNPIMSPFGDYAIALPKNPNIDKPQYYKINPDGAPGEPTAAPATGTPVATPTTTPAAEAPLATTTVAPPNGRVVTADPTTMLQPGNVAASAKRDPAIGSMYFDKTNRARGQAETQLAAKEVDKSAEAAAGLDVRAKSMRHNFDIISGYLRDHPNKALQALLEPGTTGDKRQELINAYSKAAPLLGLPQLPGEVVAAVNQLGKDSVLGGFQNVTASGLSAREAQPIIRAAMGAMPSFNLPEQSSRTLLASMEQAAQRQKDRSEFFYAYRKANGNFSAGWEQAFNKQYPPELYVARAIYNTLPEEKRREIPEAVKDLRERRDALIAAEKSGDARAADAARARYQAGKSKFDGHYGGLGNYLAFGTM